MRNRKIALAVTAAAMLAAVAGCNNGGGAPTSSVTVFTPKALATNTAVQAVKSDAMRCVPAAPLQQLALAHRLLTDTRKHPNGSWALLMACMGISKAQEKPFEAQALAAAENATPSLLTKGGRHQYFIVTLPAIVAQFANQAASASPSPSVSK